MTNVKTVKIITTSDYHEQKIYIPASKEELVELFDIISISKMESIDDDGKLEYIYTLPTYTGSIGENKLILRMLNKNRLAVPCVYNRWI